MRVLVGYAARTIFQTVIFAMLAASPALAESEQAREKYAGALEQLLLQHGFDFRVESSEPPRRLTVSGRMSRVTVRTIAVEGKVLATAKTLVFEYATFQDTSYGGKRWSFELMHSKLPRCDIWGDLCVSND